MRVIKRIWAGWKRRRAMRKALRHEILLARSYFQRHAVSRRRSDWERALTHWGRAKALAKEIAR